MPCEHDEYANNAGHGLDQDSLAFQQSSNTVRSNVETGTIKFYKQEDLPRGVQPIDLKLGHCFEGSISVQHFLLQKVWLLAFKAGKRDTRAWVADPWDASYTGLFCF